MRQARILFREVEAGVLTQSDNGSFTFRYHDLWMEDSTKPPISLTMPKTRQEYHSQFLFPCFYQLLPEGSNKEAVCAMNRIDPDDDFGILLTSAKHDSTGVIRVIKIEKS